MGLAASQARMLLLTARKSDLEFRAQQITNSEMVLAMQTEDVAKAYSLKISNQSLKYIDPEDGAVPVSASTLAALSEPGGLHLEVKGRDGKWYPWTATQPKDENGVPKKVYGHQLLGTDGKPLKGEAGHIITDAQYQALDDEEKKSYADNTVEIETQDNDYNEQELLIGLNSGNFRIVNANGGVEKIDGGTRFSVGYYSDDDNAAEAVYKTQTASIQIKEKRLQMDLQQVETQQKACDTEMDSVKKIMDKNIERTFKVFS